MKPPRVPVPAPWQRLASTRADEAAELGISERQYRRRLAKARAVLAELGDLPHVPLVDLPGSQGYWYCLDYEFASRLPMGLMRIGDAPLPAWQGSPSSGRRSRPGRLEGRLRIRHFNEEYNERDEPAKEPPKFQPKRPPRKKDCPA